MSKKLIALKTNPIEKNIYTLNSFFSFFCLLWQPFINNIHKSFLLLSSYYLLKYSSIIHFPPPLSPLYPPLFFPSRPNIDPLQKILLHPFRLVLILTPLQEILLHFFRLSIYLTSFYFYLFTLLSVQFASLIA